jgi:5-formyltetrahydrofolate cyclo-ligase
MSGKRVLREAALAARAAMSVEARVAADEALVAAAGRLARGVGTVAGYLPLPREPGGPALVDALASAAKALLLPVLRPDHDLDWARHDRTVAPGSVRARLHEPTGPRLGVSALATADLVLVPALAVDAAGIRLGRGGGSYDRALTRVRPHVAVVALLYDDEAVPVLPAEPHDRPVTAILTPTSFTVIQTVPPMS